MSTKIRRVTAPGSTNKWACRPIMIMGGLPPTTGKTTNVRRMYIEGGASSRVGQIHGTTKTIPQGCINNSNRAAIQFMCEHKVLSVNPQCSGGVGRREVVCRSNSSGKSAAIKQLRECALLNI